MQVGSADFGKARCRSSEAIANKYFSGTLPELSGERDFTSLPRIGPWDETSSESSPLGSAGRALGSEPCEDFLARNRLNPAAFHIVVAAVKRFPREGDVFETIRHDVFDQVQTKPVLRG